MTWGDSNYLHPLFCHVFIIVHFPWCLTGRSLFTLWASFVGSIKTGDWRLTAQPCHADKTITFPMFFWSPPTTKPATFSSHHHQGALKANQISRSQLRATLISNGNKEQGAWKRTKVKTSNFNPGVVTSRTGPESQGCWLRHGLGEYYRNFLNFSVYYYGVLRFKSRKLVTNPNPPKKYSNLK